MRGPYGGLLWPVRTDIVVACLLRGVGAVAFLVPFWAVAELGGVLLGGGSEQARAADAWRLVVIAAMGSAVYFACIAASGVVTHLADARLQLHIRRRLADHLGRVPLGWFGDRTSGQVKKAVQDDVSAMHHLVGHALPNLVAAIVTPLVALGYLLWVDWRLAPLTLATVPVFAVLYASMFRGYAEKMAEFNRSLDRVNSAAVEFAHGIAVIKTFGQARRSHDRFVAATEAYAAGFIAWVRPIIGRSALAETFVSPPVMLLLVLVAGTGAVSAGWLPPVEVLPFALLGLAITAPVLALGYGAEDLRTASEAARRIAALLAVEPLPTAPSPRRPDGHRLVFSGVGFSYDGRTRALDGIDLILEPGTVTAVVGASGSGKSTLARIAARFHDPDVGTVTLGGVDLRDMTSEDLYARVGMVFQDVHLLQVSIADNIALGRRGGRADDADLAVDRQADLAADVEAAARAAQIHDRIVQLPRGYDSVVGEDAQLSGGEAQRVSIARALLADPSVLLLDEATAFADPESEAAIQDALSVLARGRTVLVVAHRLHTVTTADRIVVLDAGRVIEQGRHEDLVAADGTYARMWRASQHQVATR